MLNFTSRMTKYLLFIFNFIFVITGIVLICIGGVIKAFYKEYEPFLDDKFFSAPALLVFSGSVIFFIAFFGCCGALKENQCMIFTFSVLLGAVFVMEIIAGISGYILPSKTEEIVTSKMKDSMSLYKHKDIAFLWDNLQSNMQCCGTTNYTDWYNALNVTDILPMTCCSAVPGAIGYLNCSSTSEQLHTSPCFSLLSREIHNSALSIIGTALSVAFIQFLGIVFACHLGRAVRSASYESV